MGRPLDTTRIDQAKTRAALPVRSKPYWRAIRRGAAIGYRRRSLDAGTWSVRAFIGGKMIEARLGDAADLDYPEALARAQEWIARMEGGAPRAYDVLAAIEDLARTKVSNATPRALAGFWSGLRSLAKHLSGELLGTEVESLSTADLERWRDALPVKPATKRRIYTDLAAALSNANRLHGVGDPKVWRNVKAVAIPKRKRSRVFIPTEAEVNALLAKCEPDFALLVRAAVLTGMRYGEIVALEVRDFDFEKGVLSLRVSKTGERDVVLSTAAVEFFRAQTKGKLPRAPMFTTAEGGPWKKSMQHKRMRAATSIRAFVFYSLRHYCLSRQLRAGIPSAVVARNAGTSEAILRQHYHKLIPGEDRGLFDRVEVTG